MVDINNSVVKSPKHSYIIPILQSLYCSLVSCTQQASTSTSTSTELILSTSH